MNRGTSDTIRPLTGSLVALVTPFTQHNSIDWPALERLVEWHLDQGTHGIVAVGTTGESATLDMQEHHQVIQQVVTWVNGQIPVIGGTGANSTQEALQLTQKAEQAGVDACLLVTPYYNKPTQEGLYQHYASVARAVSVPLILYNVPGRTAIDMQQETVLRLAELDQIVGIKDATGDLARGRTLLDAVPDSFAVYSGDDMTAAELMLAGAVGSISVTANVMPRALSCLADICLLAQSEHQHRQLAHELQQCLMPLHQAMFSESNPIPVKWALHAMGKIDQGIRLPLTLLTEELREPLAQLIESIEPQIEQCMAEIRSVV